MFSSSFSFVANKNSVTKERLSTYFPDVTKFVQTVSFLSHVLSPLVVAIELSLRSMRFRHDIIDMV